jgi:integrase
VGTSTGRRVRYIAAKARAKKSPKTVRNHLGLLHGIFEHAQRKGWAQTNPIKLVDKPAVAASVRVRFLDDTELEALLAAAPDTRLGRVDRTLYLVAAMTGLRQSELLALRWHDIDMSAGRVRVRENLVRGQFGTPKSKRSTRSVPLAARVAHALREHYMRTSYKADGDLVFCHPDTGGPMDRSRLLKRYKATVKRQWSGQSASTI